MSIDPLSMCSICGEFRTEGQTWFLLAESRWQNSLKILEWQEALARRNGLHEACCPEHVQELVTHWMAFGNLDFLLMNQMSRFERPRGGTRIRVALEPDLRGAREIGELAIDRESLGRILREYPDSLQILLDELYDVLQRETEEAQNVESALKVVRAC